MEIPQADLAGQQIRHVDIERGEAGTIERGRHFALPVYPLFAQDRNARAGRRECRRAARECGRDMQV